MNVNIINAVFALMPPPQNGQQSTAPWWVNMVPLVLMIVVFYFILIRPQQKQAKKVQEMLQAMKPGNKVVTNGGIIGVIVSIKEGTVTLRSADSKFEVRKSAIVEVVEREEHQDADSTPPRKG